MLSSVQFPMYTSPVPPADPLQAERPELNASADSADTFEKSAFSAMLEQLGLTSSSRLEATQDRVDFNFSFTASSSESLSASGHVAQRDQTAAISLKYTFQRAVTENGKREVRAFQADISFQAHAANALSVKPFKKKEDIMQFLNRLMNEICEVMQDDSVVLSGIIINQDDLTEIMNLDQGKVKRLFDGLLSAIMTMAMLKRIKRGNEAGPNVALSEKRRTVEGVEMEKKSSSDFSFSITVSPLSPNQTAPHAANSQTHS